MTGDTGGTTGRSDKRFGGSWMRRYRAWCCPLLGVGLFAVAAGSAQAHGSERAYILLLPTDLYMVGGVLVVALSFVVMALLPASSLGAVERARLDIGRVPGGDRMAISLTALALVFSLLVAGVVGSRDPLANPLPMTVWTIWWVGFTFIQALFGNLWAVVNPWSGAYRLLTMIPALKGWRQRPPLPYPASLGHAPAICVFLVFAWFELIHPAPQDPALLAWAVAFYVGFTSVCMVLFGDAVWLRHGEAFYVFFRIVAWLSPFDRAPAEGVLGDGPAPDDRLWLRSPGAGLLAVGTLPLSTVVFVLLVLATVSFDGLSRTFWWIDLIGENPLEYPGRTDLMVRNSIGFTGTALVLLAAYTVAVLLGRVLARHEDGIRESLGVFVVSIVPIAFGYHFAHYLPAFLVNVQYAIKALSDPYGLGWNLLGAGDMYVTASFLNNYDSVLVIWNLQVLGIVAVHVAAVVVSHILAMRRAGRRREAVLGQLPMTVLMIGYTLFGLWLLATPAIG